MYDVTFLVDIPGLSLASYNIHAVNSDKLKKEVPGHSYSIVILYYCYGVSVANSLVVYGHVLVSGHNIPSFPSVFTVEELKGDEPILLEGGQLSATFGSHGLLQSVVSQGRQMNVKLEFIKYGVKKHRETSGAYLFLPDKEAEVVPSNGDGVVVVKGPLRSSLTKQHKYVLHSVYLANSPGMCVCMCVCVCVFVFT
ncbi:Alpha-mannosidase 2 [Portunus trituberculatus]|uniref:Alpha-mannosidase 2 n=1 Tax=Portunus trituberculatus TaxID=210409 RepID=A0A5B7HIB3_PORTR|nr:Alpha-mannosidase 2 [Portunus trituberculatus]